MSNNWTTIAFSLIPLAFSMLVWSAGFADRHYQLVWFIGAFSMFGLAILAYRKALIVEKEERNKVDKERNELKQIIKDTRGSLNELGKSFYQLAQELKQVRK